MDQIKKCKTLLQNVATRELNAVEHAMKEEMGLLKKEQSSIVHDFQDEIKDLSDKNKALHDVIQDLQQQISRKSELELELKKLQAIIESKKGPPPEYPQPNPNVSPGKNRQLKQTPYKQLEEQLHAKSKEVEKYRQQFIQCSSELDRVKEARAILESTCRTWKGKFQRLVNVERARSYHVEKPSRPGSAPITQSRRDPDDLVSPDPESESQFSNRLATLPHPDEGSIASPGARVDQDDAETSDESGHLAAAEDTSNAEGPPNNDEVNASRSLLQKSPSEEPVIVRERTVDIPAKRKRGRSPATDIQKPSSVKEEILSSSPSAPNTRPSITLIQESIDLDEISGNIFTPRKGLGKRQQMYCTRSLSPSIQRLVDAHQPRNDTPKELNIQTEDSNSDMAAFEDEKDAFDDIAEVRNEAYYRRLGEEHAARLRDADKWMRAQRLRAGERCHNDRELSKHKNRKEAEMQRPSGAGQIIPGRTHVLQPTDANAILPRTGDVPPNKKRRTKPSSDHGLYHVQELADDGERNLDTENELLDNNPQDQALSSKRSAQSLTANQDAETRQRRLDQLLTRPSPEKPILGARDNRTRVAHAPSKVDPHPFLPKRAAENVAPKTPNLEREDRSSVRNHRDSVSAAASVLKPMTTPNYRSPFSSTSKKPRRSLEPPLRSRPLSQLALEDFKVNPNQNQGYGYAFKEVVRKQDQRKCLPGCTRLDCCGAIFRKMAETMPNHFYHTSRLMGPSQEVDEQGMLEDYLGDQAYRLKSMSRKQKTETLLQAKTKIVADHYGRHREVFAREPSPVGYWDVDMPNSQQAAEYGRLAEIQTRQKVQQRYQEAMKKDGLWKFRDE
ncbi:MAG: hypothetical protein LQ337_004779 [Flavoplaca oasis]|nr:MAG: hypothetical protein LQ337_004779 [Flavoplaca oasis]